MKYYIYLDGTISEEPLDFMSDTQVDFEFMAHRRGLSIDKTENAYEDGQTAMLWDWWQTAQSNEPRHSITK